MKTLDGRSEDAMLIVESNTLASVWRLMNKIKTLFIDVCNGKRIASDDEIICSASNTRDNIIQRAF